jgi:TetR/AcrR family transcriptional regulator, regulator of cefoperazone and chloramphenicol sensitivity
MTQQLLLTAIDHFGKSGFDGASTRAIASASGTAMSSITYHYGGKKGLYLAAADHIAESLSEGLGPILANAREHAAAPRNQSVETILLLLDGMATMMLSPASEPWARFIIREQQQPTEAFERLYLGAMRDVTETLVALVKRARPDLDDFEARATSIFLHGHALTLRAGRAAVHRVLGYETLDDDVCQRLRKRLRVHALCILTEEEVPS